MINSDGIEIGELASTNERMIELFRWLDAQSLISNTKRGMDIRRYEDSVAIEQYVEADVGLSPSICYWLETRVGAEAITVEGDVFAQTRDGQIVIREFTFSVDTLRELPNAWKSVIDEIWMQRDTDLTAVRAMSSGIP